MTRCPPRLLTIEADTREQKRLIFPANVRWWFGGASAIVTIKVRIVTVPTGDYAVRFRGETLAAVERKGSMNELYSNMCTRDHKRLLREWVRFQKIPYRAVLLDFPTNELFTSPEDIASTEEALDYLLRDCRRYGLDVLHLPPGRSPTRTGTFLCRWFLACLQQVRELEDATWRTNPPRLTTSSTTRKMT